MRPLIVLGLGLSVAALAGCGEGDKPVQLQYDRPAAYEIPASIRKLAIAEFGGQTDEDRRWGDIASDKLADSLEQANRTYDRYQLVDRKRLKAIMDERDLQLAISDTSTAGKVGKLANVDAMIYGSLHVVTRDEHATKQVPDLINRTTKTVPYTKRYCMVAVNFTMDDIQTSKTLTTVSVTREFDSEKDGKKGGGIEKMTSMIGMGGDKLPAADQVVNGLIEKCVFEFISRISPHKVVIDEPLQKGKSKLVTTGNTLAKEGEYAEALDLYLQAIEAKPDDAGACFNAGLMYEVTGKFGKAEEYYTRAFKLKQDARCIQARRRVRAEAANGGADQATVADDPIEKGDKPKMSKVKAKEESPDSGE
ncbi:MAG: CsgG/HfaB family protein [Phycisphaerae bacterium]|jgi:tetratricopeptide (TPR) repeat protein